MSIRGEINSNVVCIAGMHRSGTSMVAHLLNQCGLDLGSPERIMEASPENPAGYWENVDFVRLNEEILARLGGGWDFPPDIPEDGWEWESLFGLLKGKAMELSQNLADSRAWGWKDPRNSVTLPFWKKLFPNMKIVICLRNPLEVSQSLQTRNYSIPFGLNLWLIFNHRLLAAAHREDCVVTHYDVYFVDPRDELRRLSNFLGLPVSEETITRACETIASTLRNSRYSTQDLMKAGAKPEIASLYRELCAEAGPIYRQAFADKTVTVAGCVSSPRMLTSIIILTHNQIDDTKHCLASIEAHTPEPFELIIVDNGSTDGTVDYLRGYKSLHDNVRVIANATNRGFASGNNQGLAIARGEYLLLLNNDTVVTEGWLGRMIGVFDRHQDVGIVGPVSNCVSGPQLVESVPYRELSGMHRFAASWAARHACQTIECHRVVGFCLLARKAVIDRIGGLDEQFGSGNFEDDDLCIRAAGAGFKSRIARDVFIHHTGSQTFKGAGIDYHRIMLRNWELFKAKWHIPADIALGQRYQISVMASDVPRCFVSLIAEQVLADHQPIDDGRWWQEVVMTDSPEREAEVQGEGDGPRPIELPQDALETAVATDETEGADIWNRLGYGHFMAGKLPEAEEAFKQGLASFPDNLDLLSNLGDLYLQMGEFDRATDYLKRALAVDANDVNVLLSLGTCYLQLGGTETALTAFRRVQALAPETEGVQETVDRLEGMKAG